MKNMMTACLTPSGRSVSVCCECGAVKKPRPTSESHGQQSKRVNSRLSFRIETFSSPLSLTAVPWVSVCAGSSSRTRSDCGNVITLKPV